MLEVGGDDGVLMAQGTMRVLVVEDDRKLANALRLGISAEGYEVTVASTAEEGFFLLHRQQPDLLLLDVTLPNRSGLDLLQQIRQERIDVRVMLLTSHNNVDDRVQGLRSGADDYLGKPFSFPELMARIEALLRRILPPTQPGNLTIGTLSLNARERTAMREGVKLDLTTR